jgi:hypothetical protein
MRRRGMLMMVFLCKTGRHPKQSQRGGGNKQFFHLKSCPEIPLRITLNEEAGSIAATLKLRLY